jgi:sugar/nucleoside kinase (ribokinase family)
LASGSAIGEAMRFAAAAGALCVTRHGAQASLPDRAQVTSFLADGRTGGS